MTDRIIKMQRDLNKASKRDWKRQNFVNMVSLYQSELVKEGLEDIWGSHTGFSYSTSNGLDELLNFVPPVQTSYNPSYDLGPFMFEESQSSLNPYAESFNSSHSSVESMPEPLSLENSPKNSYMMPSYENTNSAQMGMHDISFLNKYARFLTPNSFVCQVQFKYSCRDYSLTEYLMSTQTIDIGTMLVVRSHVDIRQIDMGVVVRIMTCEEYKEYKSYIGKSVDPDENYVGQVLRVAFKKDTKKLTLKHTTEATLLPIAQNLATVHHLPILVYGIEFQYDGFNLFVFYTRKSGCDRTENLDFKPYIYDLIVDCPHTRIIMKDTTNSRPFAPDPMAEKKLKKL